MYIGNGIYETRFENEVIIEDEGVNYVYNLATDEYHEANNLELEFLRPRGKYERQDMEIDNWKFTN